VPVAVAIPVFLAGIVVSLSTSYLLVTRLERLGERVGLSEGLLGVVAALAADAPEITSAVTALSTHQQKVGAGVIIGSNVFNLAALLGLGAVTAGGIALHRRVVLLGGVTGIWVAGCAWSPPWAWFRPPPAWPWRWPCWCLHHSAELRPCSPGAPAGRAALAEWLAVAVSQEEQELNEAIRPIVGRRRDVVVAGIALLLV